MRSRSLPLRLDWPQAGDRGRPGDLHRAQLRAQQHPDRLLLDREGAPSVRTDVVGRRDQQAVRELRTRRRAEERVQVGLNRVRGVVVLRLNRPETAVAILGNEVDADVTAAPPRPVVPEPDSSCLGLRTVSHRNCDSPPSARTAAGGKSFPARPSATGGSNASALRSALRWDAQSGAG